MTNMWFYPMAETLDGRILATYDDTPDLARARMQIALWQDWYHLKLKRAWIQKYENGVATMDAECIGRHFELLRWKSV